MRNRMKLVSYYTDYGNPDMWDENSSVECVCDDFVIKGGIKEKKVAMLVEPRSFIPEAYKYIEEHYEEYKYIFTFDDVLLKLPNAKRIIYGTYWCSSDEKKEKGVSMICSDKEYLEGHRKRKEIARILDKEGLVDVMGAWNGGSYVEPIEALRDYKFSVAMENDKQDYYFTEKLCNCLANKVVPIYYGARKIGDFFDIDGIIYVEDRDDIPNIIRNLNIDEEYKKRKKAIDKNYELVKEFRVFDEWLYKTYEKEIGELFNDRNKLL